MRIKDISFFKRRVFKHTLFYTLFAFLNRGVTFLLLPFFTRYLTPEEYGIYALFLMAVVITEPLLTLGAHYAIPRVYFVPERFSISQLVSSIVWVAESLLVFIISIAAILYIFSYINKNLFIFFSVVPLVSLSNALTNVLKLRWQVKEEPIPFGVFNLGSAILKIVVNIIIVLIADWGWQGVVVAQGVIACSIISFASYLLWRNAWLGFFFDRKALLFGIKMGIGYVPGVLTNFFNESIGKFFLLERYALTDLGIYSVGQKFGSVVDVFSNSFLNAYNPWLFRQLSGKTMLYWRKIVLSVFFASLSFFLFAWTACLVFYCFSEIFLGVQFQEASVYIWGASTAYALSGTFNVISGFIYYTKQTWILAALSFVAVGLHFIFLYIFVNALGIIGVIYAPICAWVVVLLIAVMVVLKLWKTDRWR